MQDAAIYAWAETPNRSSRRRSVSGDETAVNVQGLAGDERGPFEVQDGLDNVSDLAEAPQRVHVGDAFVRRESWMVS
jgi:hypothetical protein